MENIFHNKKFKLINSIIGRAVSLLIALFSIPLSFYLVEKFNGTDIFKMRPSVIGVNILFYLLIFLFGYIVFRHLKYAALTVLVVSTILSVGNHYAKIFRGNPLYAADLFSLKTAMNVSGHYDITPDAVCLKFLLLFINIIVLYFMFPFAEHIFKKNVWRQIFGAILLFLFVIWLIFGIDLPRQVGLSIHDESFQKVYEKYGTLASFMLSADELKVKKPDNYYVDEVEGIMKDYIDSKPSVTSNDKVNIIVVVDETFCDLSLFDDLPTNQDVLPYFHSLNDNVISGTLTASVYGGNTANSEYEFLSGHSMAFMGAGTVVFQNLDTHTPSIADVARADGYVGINAYHPGLRSSWNREEAYNCLDFNNFYDLTYYENVRNIRGLASDESFYENMIKEYEKYVNSDKPVFLYGMTIQNHGGYEKDSEGVPDTIRITDETYNDSQFDMYLNLLKESDSALEKFVKYFENRDEKVLILFFGDHQPKLPDGITNKLMQGNERLKYDAPFKIIANYDISSVNEGGSANEVGSSYDIGRISINYLGAYLMRLAGNSLSPYEEYLLDLYETIPAITANGYYDKAGNFYLLDDKTSPYYGTIEEYRRVQYNNTCDTDNCINEFFFMNE